MGFVSSGLSLPEKILDSTSRTFGPTGGEGARALASPRHRLPPFHCCLAMSRYNLTAKN